MTILYNADDFDIKEFYRYPTCVVYRIAEYDEGFHPGGNEDVKNLFNALLSYTADKLNIHIRELQDNKIAIKVIYKPTNTIMYIGYKDYNWSIGFDLNKYQTGEKIIIK